MQIVRKDLLDEMFRIQWQFDPDHPNGNTYGGSIEAYCLGVWGPYDKEFVSRLKEEINLEDIDYIVMNR